MNRAPTLHSDELVATPSVLPPTQTVREPPRKQIFHKDKLDKILSIDELNQSHSPPGFVFQKVRKQWCVL